MSVKLTITVYATSPDVATAIAMKAVEALRCGTTSINSHGPFVNLFTEIATIDTPPAGMKEGGK